MAKKPTIQLLVLAFFIIFFISACGGGNTSDSDACKIQNSANCYAYAFNWMKSPITGNFFPGKPQPGQFAKPPISCDPPSTTCIVDAVNADAKELGKQFISTTKDAVCPTGTYKIALVIANIPPSADADYHWYRQNPDGTWSHKPGTTPVTNKDGAGAIITDPATANRTSGDLIYDEFGGYFCTGG